MALIKRKKSNEETRENYNSYTECYESAMLSHRPEVIDSSTISKEYRKLHFSAEELDDLLKKYGLDRFDWSSVV